MGDEGRVIFDSKDADIKKKVIAAKHMSSMKADDMSVKPEMMMPEMMGMMSGKGDMIRDFISEIIDKMIKDDTAGKISDDTMEIIKMLKEMGLEDSEISPEIIDLMKEIMGMKGGDLDKMGLKVPYTSTKKPLKVPYTATLDFDAWPVDSDVPISSMGEGSPEQTFEMDDMMVGVATPAPEAPRETLSIPKSDRMRAIKFLMMLQHNDLPDIDKDISMLAGKDDMVRCKDAKDRVIDEIGIVKQDILDLEDMLPGELAELMDVKKQLLADMAKVSKLDEDCPTKLKKLRTIKRSLILKKKEDV